MKLIINWEDFQQETNSIIAEGFQLSNNKNLQNSYENEKTLVDAWIKKIISLFSNSFDDKTNEFTIGITNLSKANENPFNNINIYGQRQNSRGQNVVDDHTKNSDLYRRVDEIIKISKYYLKFISASDKIINSDKLDITNRSNYTSDKILELILEKLYILYDNSYHSIKSILEYNGVHIRRYDEEREYAKALEIRGLVNLMRTKDISAQLTLQGKMYVEDMQKAVPSNYDNIVSDNTDFSELIDEILEHLKKIGIGQEIIFDEINELKDLHSKLNKKNFGQVVKGKLLDLALSKLVENDTISYIYNKITNEALHLL